MMPDPRMFRRLDEGLVLLLAALSVWHFLMKEPSAYDWPALDMAPFLRRQADPAYIPHDFYTNVSCQANPRFVFGYTLLGLQQLLGTDWYGTMFFFRVALVVLTPPAIYLALSGIVLRKAGNDPATGIVARAMVALGTGLVIKNSVNFFFSIAWFRPLALGTNASVLAFLLGMAGAALMTRLTSRWRYLGIAFWLVGTLQHPAVGMMAVAFYYLATLESFRWREAALVMVASVLTPIGLITVWFRAPASLSAAEFVQSYVITNHPFHYHLAEFGTLSGQPWWISFATIAGLMTAAGVQGMLRWRKFLARDAAIFLAVYVACVALQYVFIDLIPNKAIATVGPVRFSLFAYYKLVILLTLSAIDWIPDWLTRRKIDLGRVLTLVAARVSLHPALVTAALAGVICAGGFWWRDDPVARLRQADAGLYDWIARHTTTDDVILPYSHELTVNLPLVAARAVPAGNGFPFREDAFAEYDRRHAAAFGSAEELEKTPGGWIVEKYENVFHGHNPADFVHMADEFRVDYLVLKADRTEQLREIAPTYRDDKFAVYRVADLRTYVAQRPTERR